MIVGFNIRKYCFEKQNVLNNLYTRLRCAQRRRELAARQDQAAISFREAIQHSIAVDCYSATLIGAPKHHNSHNHLSCRHDANLIEKVFPANDDGQGSTSAALFVRGDSGVNGNNKFNFANPTSGEKREGVIVGNAQEFQDDKDGVAHLPKDIQRKCSGVGASHYGRLPGKTEDHQRTSDGTEQTTLDDSHAGETETDKTVVGFDSPIAWTTRELTADLCRLASRQYEAACELLLQEAEGGCRETVSSSSRKALPHQGDVMAALGQSVGLQAKAVGLMEEVVTRTLHSRVSQLAVSVISRVVIGGNR